MKKKIVIVPLDERPCNMFFPERLFLNEDFNIVRPETLGNKKLPADLDKLASFLRKECKDADGLILSVDTLLYGGLIPSRIHHETKETLLSRMELIREIKGEYPLFLLDDVFSELDEKRREYLFGNGSVRYCYCVYPGRSLTRLE